MSADGLDGLSMRGLAERAQLSTRTLYNLYGAKEDILFALMAEKLEELDRALAELPFADPLERSRALITTDIDQLLRREAFHRSLLHELDLRTKPPRQFRLLGRASALQEDALYAAMQAGMLDACFAPRLLAHQILFAHGQAIRLWARGLLDSRELRTQSLHARALYLCAAATDASRERLRNEVFTLRPELEAIVERFAALALAAPSFSATLEPLPAGDAAWADFERDPAPVRDLRPARAPS